MTKEMTTRRLAYIKPFFACDKKSCRQLTSIIDIHKKMLSTQCKTGEHYEMVSSQPDQTDFGLRYFKNEVNSSD